MLLTPALSSFGEERETDLAVRAGIISKFRLELLPIDSVKSRGEIFAFLHCDCFVAAGCISVFRAGE